MFQLDINVLQIHVAHLLTSKRFYRQFSENKVVWSRKNDRMNLTVWWWNEIMKRNHQVYIPDHKLLDYLSQLEEEDEDSEESTYFWLFF